MLPNPCRLHGQSASPPRRRPRSPPGEEAAEGGAAGADGHDTPVAVEQVDKDSQGQVDVGKQAENGLASYSLFSTCMARRSSAVTFLMHETCMMFPKVRVGRAEQN